MDSTELPPDAVYRLSREYLDHAHKASTQLQDEDDLKDYYRLISMSIQSLQYLKTKYPLSIDQDAKITYELAEILLEETFNFDLAESYLSAIRERLQYHHNSGSNWPILQEKMRCEFLALYVLPMKKDERFHYKVALRNCDELIEFLKHSKNENGLTQSWLLVFQYINIWHNIKLGNKKRIIVKFNDLRKNGLGTLQWRGFIALSYFNFLLNQRLPIPDDLREHLSKITCEEIGPKLYGWKLMLELISLIYEDKNITDKLNCFKQLFAEHKDALNDTNNSVKISVGPNVALLFHLSSIFQYKDIKNILLLLQSVSYLVNCYDKKANFSARFLPKVRATTKDFIKSIEDGPKPISNWDLKFDYYQSIQGFAEFYQRWEQMILTGKPPSSLGKLDANHDYSALLDAIASQMDAERNDLQVCSKYRSILSHKFSSNEVRMISLLNLYVIKASSFSKSVGKEDVLADCNLLWSQITKTLEDTDLRFNTTWDCTVTILWTISHFEPFTSNPMPLSEEERAANMKRLRLYYMANKLIEPKKSEEFSKYKIKRSLLLQILLNYVGGRLFEQDLSVISKISEACFRLAKHQKNQILEYVIGLWHLMNCTISMKSEEVIQTNAKLNAIVNELTDGHHA